MYLSVISLYQFYFHLQHQHYVYCVRQQRPLLEAYNCMRLSFRCIYIAIQLELVSSSLMVDENSGSGGESGKVTLMVSRTDGLTERPVTVFLVTSDEAEDGIPLLGVVESLLVCFDCFDGNLGFF